MEEKKYKNREKEMEDRAREMCFSLKECCSVYHCACVCVRVCVGV